MYGTEWKGFAECSVGWWRSVTRVGVLCVRGWLGFTVKIRLGEGRPLPRDFQRRGINGPIESLRLAEG